MCLNCNCSKKEFKKCMALEENSFISESDASKIRLNRNLYIWLKSLLKIWWLFLIVGLLAGIAGVTKVGLLSRWTMAVVVVE